MERFRGLVFKLAEAQPNAPLPPARRVLLQDRLDEFVSQYKTPDHPPYSAMIERALSELNDRRGSSEESITRYLQKSYNPLPLEHSALLEHHLRKLCESGEVILTRGKRYMLPSQIATLNLRANVKRNPKRTHRWDFEKQRKSQCKVWLIKKRNPQNSKKAELELVEKDCESDEEPQLNDCRVHSVGKQDEEGRMKRLWSCDGEENCVHDDHSVLHTDDRCLNAANEKIDKGLYLQEIRSSGVTETDTGDAHMKEQQQAEYDSPNPSSPGRLPGSIRVENLSCMLLEEMMPLASPEELSESKCTVGQVRRWSRLREPRAAAMTSPGSFTSPKSEEFHSQPLGHSDQKKRVNSTPISVEQMAHEKHQSRSLNADVWDAARSVTDNTNLKGEEKYRRRRANPKQSRTIALDGFMESVHPTGTQCKQIPGQCSKVDVQPQPLQQQEGSCQQTLLRRSQRARQATHKIAEGGNMPQHCLEESPKTFCRQRPRPSKPKPSDQIGTNRSQHRIEGPPKFQRQKRQLKLKFVNRCIVDDYSEQDSAQSRNCDGSTSLSSPSKTAEALRNSKRKLQEEQTKERRLVILPQHPLDRGKTKSAKTKGDNSPPIILALGHGHPIKRHKHNYR